MSAGFFYRIGINAMVKGSFFLLCLSIISNNVSGQQSSTKIEGEETNFLVRLYRSAIGEYSPVYTGLQYLNYDNNIIGHQYFDSDQPTRATLVYNNIRYENFPLLYDIHLDEIIAIHDSTSMSSMVNKRKIMYFIIHDQKFINVTTDAPGLKYGIGIYNLIYDSEWKVLVKRRKIIDDRIEDLSYIREFLNEDVYMVKIQDQYHVISNKASLLKLFGDQRKSVKKHLKKSMVKFKKDKEAAILAAVFYFEGVEQGK